MATVRALTFAFFSSEMYLIVADCRCRRGTFCFAATDGAERAKPRTDLIGAVLMKRTLALATRGSIVDRRIMKDISLKNGPGYVER